MLDAKWPSSNTAKSYIVTARDCDIVIFIGTFIGHSKMRETMEICRVMNIPYENIGTDGNSTFESTVKRLLNRLPWYSEVAAASEK